MFNRGQCLSEQMKFERGFCMGNSALELVVWIVRAYHLLPNRSKFYCWSTCNILNCIQSKLFEEKLSRGKMLCTPTEVKDFQALGNVSVSLSTRSSLLAFMERDLTDWRFGKLVFFACICWGLMRMRIGAFRIRLSEPIFFLLLNRKPALSYFFPSHVTKV